VYLFFFFLFLFNKILSYCRSQATNALYNLIFLMTTLEEILGATMGLDVSFYFLYHKFSRTVEIYLILPSHPKLFSWLRSLRLVPLADGALHWALYFWNHLLYPINAGLQHMTEFTKHLKIWLEYVTQAELCLKVWIVRVTTHKFAQWPYKLR
jgi:hypothetical protein